jgi:ABC-2 type transport system ATP-binding protein
VIEVRELTKRYRDRVALDRITFTVGKGEIVGLLGPNGAGKSTALRILAGSLAATSGSARVGGFDVFEEPLAAKRCLGYLPETPPLYEAMTVRGQLRFAADLKGLPRRQRDPEVERVAGRAGVDQVLDRVIGNLSKGYRQRAGIAQALVGDPAVLILDEPTVGLDPSQIREVRALVRSLAGRHTVLLSTHLLPEAALTCAKVLVLAGGRLVDFDTLPGLVARHLPGRTVALEEIGVREEIYERRVHPPPPAAA